MRSWKTRHGCFRRFPPGRKAIGSRWVFKVKRHDDGIFRNFKARFVAQGFSQIFGSNYDEIFAPTATLRIRFALAASWSTFASQLDVRSAFLNANFIDEIYIEQPEGFAQAEANGETLHCKLQKCIHGLKQAGREWNKSFTQSFLKNEFVQSAEDHCLFVAMGLMAPIFLY